METSNDIDVSKLQRELVSALESDRRYARENDAKFRAVSQKVASYEEFRDIVKASHLQPLERQDIIGGSRNQPWNATARTNGRDKDELDVFSIKGCGQPENAQEFIRQWRYFKGNTSEQYQLLVQLSFDKVNSILRTEASITILGDVLKVFQEHFSDKDVEKVMNILTVLSKTPRFGLSIDLLNRSEKQAITELLEMISLLLSSQYEKEELMILKYEQDCNILSDLRIAYKINSQ